MNEVKREKKESSLEKQRDEAGLSFVKASIFAYLNEYRKLSGRAFENITTKSYKEYPSIGSGSTEAPPYFSTARTSLEPPRESGQDILYRILEALYVSNEIAMANYNETKKNSEFVKSIDQSLQAVNIRLEQLDYGEKLDYHHTEDEIENAIREKFAYLSYLNLVVLRFFHNEVSITFVHESEDKVKALYEIEDLLLQLEDDFPEIDFQPRLLQLSTVDESELQGKRITFKESDKSYAKY